MPIIALLVILTSQGAAGADVVFGSFVQREPAEKLRDRVESDLAVDAGIVGVDIRGEWYLRVVATGFESESDARDFMAKARRSGYPDAWYLADPVGRLPQPNEPEPTDPARTPTTMPGPAEVAGPAEIAQPAEVAQPAEAAQPTEVAGPAEVAQPTEVAQPVATRNPAARETDDQPSPETTGRRVGGTLKFATSSNGGETITVPRYDGVDIRFDGRLDEAVWSEVGGYDNMVLVEPGTLAKPRHRTVARYLHTVRGVYIGVWNEQPRRTLAGRGATDHDAWGITLDTSGDGRHGHWFNIALSTAVDGTSGPGSANGPREPTWQYATAVLRNGWSLEAFLPWSALSLPSLEEDRVMGMYVNRRVAYVNERWGWPASFTPTRDTTER